MSLLLLSPHFQNGGTGYGDWLKAKPRVVKLCGAFPTDSIPADTLVIGRATVTDDGVSPDMGAPEKVAQDYFFGKVLPVARLNPWIKYWEAQNEPGWDKGKTAEQYRADMRWYARYHAEFTRLCWEHGLFGVIGSWSVGTPYLPAAADSVIFTPDDAAKIWDSYTPALAAIRSYGAVFSRHSYGAFNEWLALRHRADYRAFKRLGYGDIKIVVTECGEDFVEGSKPWKLDPRYNGNLRTYFDKYLAPLEFELRKDADYLIGATVFTLGTGGGGWENFDVASNEIGGWMQQLANTGIITTPTPPTPIKEKPLYSIPGAGFLRQYYYGRSIKRPVIRDKPDKHELDIFEEQPYGGLRGVWKRVTSKESGLDWWMREGV